MTKWPFPSQSLCVLLFDLWARILVVLFSKKYNSLSLPTKERQAEFFKMMWAFYFFFNFYFISKLYIIVLVLPNIKMNPPQVYMCSPSWNLLPPPSSLPIPSLWVVPVHQPQASSIVHRTWTGNSFHTWYFICFNAILPKLPTLSLSHRVHKTVLYISVSFAVSYTGLLLPSF